MKHTLRKQLIEMLKAMPPAIADDKSRLACQRILSLPEFQRAQVVMAYLNVVHELSVDPLVREALNQGKTVLSPKVSWEPRTLLPLALTSLDGGLEISEYGIREPVGAAAWLAERIDLVIVPALAFDRRGLRLGRGGGFYDRFLAEPSLSAVTCGIAFDDQLVDSVPVYNHDKPVQMLVTDAQTLRF